MHLIYHPDAETELVKSARFYERKIPGLGVRFLDAVSRTVVMIQEDPKRWRVRDSEVRGCHVPRFPYTVYYRILPDHIRVLAVQHHSRRPRYWRYRLSE